MAIIFGTSDNNVLPSKKPGDIILGLDGDDTLEALHGFNILLGGDGDDILTALSSFNILSGGEGDDTLRAYFGWNLLLGGNGDDDLTSYADGNILNGGDGDDSLAVQSDFNTLIGGAGDDLFNILGGSGNTVRGGDGRDTISYSGTTQGVVINLAAGAAAGIGMLSGVENVIGGEGNDIITGDDNDNVLEGGGGNDTLEGGAGNDTVDGGAGDDLIIGGEGAGDDTYQGGGGNDTASYASTTQGVAASLASGVATGVEIGTDTLIDIENLIGGTGNDSLTGDAAANLLDGSAGDDFIKGGAGDDILMGGEGLDTLSYDDSPNRVIVNMFNTSMITVDGITVDPGHAFDGFTPPPVPSPAPTDTVSGFETVIGSAFNDYIQGSTNVANLLIGGAGNDTLAGSGMSDGIDPPVAGAANDTLLGGAGNDVFRQSRGNDVIDGGEDFDTLIFVNTGIPYGGTTGVKVNLALGFSDADPNGGDTAHGAGGDVATITGIERVVGTDGNDILIGDANFNFLDGGAGNDTIDGGGSVDFLAGGGGFDTLSYEDSPTRVIVNMFGATTIVIDEVSVAPGTAFDGFGTFDTISGFENVIGSAFDDYLQGMSNIANRFEGGAGNDTLVGSGVNDDIDPSVPGSANDTLLGGPGNDVLRQTRGNDIIDGGEGFDRLEFVNNGIPYGGTTGVNVNLATGNSYADPNDGDVVNDADGDRATISGIEFVLGTAGNDTLIGDANANRIEGRGGTDVLDGGAGNDTVVMLVTTGDSDAADGNTGTDTLVLSGVVPGDGVAVANLALADQVVTIGGVADALVQQNFENLDASGLGSSINVTGDSGANTLIGSSGNDTIDGGAGDDTIKGGAGDDILMGGAGFDTLSYDDSPNRVIVNLFNTSTITVGGITVDPGHAFDGFTPLPAPVPPPTDTVSGFEAVIGSAFNDYIQGSTNVANLLMGGDGNDTLAGSGGSDGINPPEPLAANDTLVGGAGNDLFRQSRGNDVIDGGEDFDTLIFVNTGIPYGGTTGVNVNLALGFSDADPNDGDAVHGPGGDVATISGIEAVLGTLGNDTLIGDDNANSLQGQDGNDFIEGGGGADTLTGNAGIDTFKYHATSDSDANLFLSDFIVDFLHGTDKIDLSAIDANTGLDGNQDFLFGGSNSSTVANSVTWSESGGVTTVLQIDNDGDAIADMQLILLGTGLGLSDADFIL